MQTDDQKASRFRTDISTYITVPDGRTKLLYSAEVWVSVRLTLLTAGSVDVGTREDISPVLSGKGGTLITNEEFEFTLPLGNRLYVVANSIERVRVVVQPFAWLQQLYEAAASTSSELQTGVPLKAPAPPSSPVAQERTILNQAIREAQGPADPYGRRIGPPGRKRR